ncbi:DUF3109 family protein [bacterium]|nr:DUF3109 family protein [bacterium]
MLLHENVLISFDVIQKEFVCNLNACKGACCVEGDYGAPLLPEELPVIEKDLEVIRPYLSHAANKLLDKTGFYETDGEGELATTCLPKGECVFVIKENGMYKCGIEKAWEDGKTQFKKPISCHLYPIRISKVGEYEGLNYHKWQICNAACKLGKQLEVPIYLFLKEALERKYGKAWFEELENIVEEIKGDLPE